MWNIARLFALLFALSAAPAFAGPSEDANLLIDRWVTAFNANDAEAVVKLYTPDAILLGTSSPIMSEGTAAIQAYFSRLPGSGFKAALGEHRTIILSDGAVVATGFYDFTLVVKGEPSPLAARFTMLLVKRDGQWLIEHHHSSQRPKPPQ